MEGEHLTYDRLGQIAEAGRLLAEFHMVAKEFPGPVMTDEVSNNTRLWWNEGEAELYAIAARYDGRELNDELRLLRQWHGETLKKWPLERLEALPKGLAHGDWHGRNMIFVGDCIAAVFDFDDMNEGFLAEDLAFGVRMFGRENPRSVHIRADAAQAFLSGYEGLRAIASEEREAILLFLTNPRPPILTWAMMVERLGLDPVPILKTEVARMAAFRSDSTRIARLVAVGGE